MKYSIYTFLFTIISFSLSAQEQLDNGRSYINKQNKVVSNNTTNENGTTNDIYKGSDQDDPNAPIIKAKEDVYYPINLEELKSKIRNNSDSQDINQKIDDLTQRVYELTLFNEQLSQENQDIKASLMNCCNAQKTNSKSFLVQNSPNPFNEYTKIDYYIGDIGNNAKIVIRTLDGAVVKSLDIKESGYNSFDLTSEGFSAGYYVYTLYNDSEIIDSKVLIIAE